MELGLVTPTSSKWSALTRPDSPAPTITTSETLATDMVHSSPLFANRTARRGCGEGKSSASEGKASAHLRHLGSWGLDVILLRWDVGRAGLRDFQTFKRMRRIHQPIETSPTCKHASCDVTPHLHFECDVVDGGSLMRLMHVLMSSCAMHHVSSY